MITGRVEGTNIAYDGRRDMITASSDKLSQPGDSGGALIGVTTSNALGTLGGRILYPDGSSELWFTKPSYYFGQGREE